jgi:hypothetical protein
MMAIPPGKNVVSLQFGAAAQEIEVGKSMFLLRQCQAMRAESSGI